MSSAAPPVPPLKSITIRGLAPGPRLIVTAAVHGNEVCSTRAIERLLGELDAGELVVRAGALTLVPVANPLAYALRRRAGDRNLNRALAPTAQPREFEDHVANWLCPLLAAHDVLLDLHSFQAGGVPFVMVGPADNRGPLEPFAHAAQEQALACRLGVARAVDGWLATYAAGVGRRRAEARALGLPEAPDQHPRRRPGGGRCVRRLDRVPQPPGPGAPGVVLPGAPQPALGRDRTRPMSRPRARFSPQARPGRPAPRARPGRWPGGSRP